MNVHGRHDKCQERDACHGPGCRIHTGKTAHKQNWARSKPNQHEGSRVTDSATKKGKSR